jgi:hypothetical protein
MLCLYAVVTAAIVMFGVVHFPSIAELIHPIQLICDD